MPIDLRAILPLQVSWWIRLVLAIVTSAFVVLIVAADAALCSIDGIYRCAECYQWLGFVEVFLFPVMTQINNHIQRWFFVVTVCSFIRATVIIVHVI